MTIKTGCSSGLVGLHTACHAIQAGECSAALVCGTNLIIDPGMTIAMTEQGVLSPTGQSKSFDAKADGYARAEAINAVYIKKSSVALRDNDPIRAPITSTATNADGKTLGIAQPNSASHIAMMRQAHLSAGLKCSDTTFIECHGPGTPAGDAAEGQAVAEVFGEKGVFMGSVKPNMGHSEGAAGVTSLIKAVLALERGIIPPNINFKTPNPRIPFVAGRLTVPTEPTSWPWDRVRRASVNSFGFGGANAHAILDSAVQHGIVAPKTHHSPSPKLLLFSANHQASLERLIESYRSYARDNQCKMKDLAYTLACRREHLPLRTFSVSDGFKSIVTEPSQKIGHPPLLIFVFTGQGAQWPCMAKSLISEYPSFATDIRQMQQYLRLLSDGPLWNIEGEDPSSYCDTP